MARHPCDIPSHKHGSKRGRQAHGPRAVPPYGSVCRATANGCSAEHEGQQEGLRAEREADGGMRGRVAPRCGLVLLCMGLVLLFTDGGVIERQRRGRYKRIANWGGGITVPYFFLLGKVNGRHAESSLVSEQVRRGGAEVRAVSSRSGGEARRVEGRSGDARCERVTNELPESSESVDASESTPDRTNLFPPTLSNPATILPGVAATLGEGGMDGSVLPGAGLLGLRRRLRCCSTSEAILSLLHVRGILPERGTSPAAAVELAGRGGERRHRPGRGHTVRAPGGRYGPRARRSALVEKQLEPFELLQLARHALALTRAARAAREARLGAASQAAAATPHTRGLRGHRRAFRRPRGQEVSKRGRRFDRDLEGRARDLGHAVVVDRLLLALHEQPVELAREGGRARLEQVEARTRQAQQLREGVRHRHLAAGASAAPPDEVAHVQHEAWPHLGQPQPRARRLGRHIGRRLGRHLRRRLGRRLRGRRPACGCGTSRDRSRGRSCSRSNRRCSSRTNKAEVHADEAAIHQQQAVLVIAGTLAVQQVPVMPWRGSG
eukprot:scaffold127083_cov66-Phaeocystis_antarctica.AAC.5